MVSLDSFDVCITECSPAPKIKKCQEILQQNVREFSEKTVNEVYIP